MESEKIPLPYPLDSTFDSKKHNKIINDCRRYKIDLKPSAEIEVLASNLAKVKIDREKKLVSDLKEEIESKAGLREAYLKQLYETGVADVKKHKALAVQKLLVPEYDLGLLSDVKPNGEVVRAKPEEPAQPKKEKFEDVAFDPDEPKRKRQKQKIAEENITDKESKVCSTYREVRWLHALTKCQYNAGGNLGLALGWGEYDRVVTIAMKHAYRPTSPLSFPQTLPPSQHIPNFPISDHITNNPNLTMSELIRQQQEPTVSDADIAAAVRLLLGCENNTGAMAKLVTAMEPWRWVPRVMLQRPTRKSVLLSVNHEARREAIDSMRYVRGGWDEGVLSKAFFNPTTDIVWLLSGDYYEDLIENMAIPINLIKALAISSKYWYGQPLMSDIFRKFGEYGIEEMLLIVGPETISNYRMAQLVEPRNVSGFYGYLPTYGGDKKLEKEIRPYEEGSWTEVSDSEDEQEYRGITVPKIVFREPVEEAN
ncbi:uncharacterized protein PAC_16606 [Phialocephala subalpina]|uniref:Uncharacterized protein n=1 Tax=Phialocephala subalpina TaxID=576137 RepID=A0A1L7XNS9_9HELO|nr:uncharacterized protein PAC_16606 [Phialocephala subalpina]